MQSGLDRFTCSVCLELFSSPVIIPCEHTFCSSCLDTSTQTSGNNTCPVCRQPFDPSSRSEDGMMKRAMQITRTKCPNCGLRIVVSLLKSHQQTSCGLGGAAVATYVPQGAQGYTSPGAQGYTPQGAQGYTPPGAQAGRNLYTFSCPYCSQVKLDYAGLLKHVNDLHKHENRKVVCPICSVMPWGDTSQISTDFIQHVNLRHRFEYDRFVDFQVDEKQAYERTLAKSAQEF